MQECDLIINAGWIAPVEPDTNVLHDSSLAVRDGRIAAIGKREAIAANWQARKTLERREHLLIPGLVNTHTHAAMSLMRGMADDQDLQRWLSDSILPCEAKHVSEEMVRDGTRLAMAEMIRGGTTCFADMYFFPDVCAATVTAARMRACVGLIVFDSATAWAESVDEYLSKGLAVYDEYAAHPLVSFMFTPDAAHSLSDETLARIKVQADQLDIGVHLHLHETARQIDHSIAQCGLRPFQRLQNTGFINSSLLAVHMTQLTDAEITAAAAAGISVAHCPESNMKLASGMTPSAALIAAGVNVSLGTDGAASNNDLDMLGEMRTAALLGKAVAGDASVLDAASVLRMATLNGARSLGLDEKTGSLVPGKWADITCVDLSGTHTCPVYDPLSSLVYSARASDVSDVWVAGRALLSEGVLTTLDESAIKARAREWQERIATTT